MASGTTSVTISHAGRGAYAQTADTARHTITTDTTTENGGDNLGPTPVEALLASLGSCTAITMRMYAARKGWAIDRLDVRLSHAAADGKDVIDMEIILQGPLDAAQRDRLLEIAGKCPVHKILSHGPDIRTRLAAE